MSPEIQTPSHFGYRMPAEWQPHSGTWLSWPRRAGFSFRPRFDEVVPTFGALTRALSPHETVHINVNDSAHESEARAIIGDCTNVQFHRIPTNEPWCRDHGPTFLTCAPHLNPTHKPRRTEPTPSPSKEGSQPSELPSSGGAGGGFVGTIRNRAVVGSLPQTAGERRLDDPLARPTGEGQGEGLVVIDWDYNAYGSKYPRFDNDCAVPERIARLLNIPVFKPRIVLEGGSFDVNGTGSLLTTEACLLHPNRNPHLSKIQIEQYLRDYLGVTEIIWLGIGIIGDDTDGHVDDIARFVSPETIVTVVETNPLDDNYTVLQDNLQRLRQTRFNIVELPMPGAVVQHDRRLPASYANFYIANGVVIVPTFRDPNDDRACAILQSLFPDRQVVPLDSTVLIWGRGSFHCVTQQQPAIIPAQTS